MNREPTMAERMGFSAADALFIRNAAFDLVDAGELDGAATIFIGLLALNPRDAAIRAALGAVYEKQGRIPEAEAAYSEALELDPNTVVARLNRGLLRLRRGDRGGLEDLEVAAQVDSVLKPKAQGVLRSMKL